MHCVATTCTVLQPSATCERSRCGRHMLQPAARCCAAVRLAASDSSKRSEGAAGRIAWRVCGTVDEHWLRRKRGRAFDCPEHSRRREISEDSVDVRVTGFGSEQPRPTSALSLGVRLGLRVGPRTRAQHGPTALRWWPRGDGASRSAEVEACWLLGRAARAGGATGPACGRLAGGGGGGVQYRGAPPGLGRPQPGH